MALTSSDERTLLLPLLEGGDEPSPWRTFLGRLAQRTGAILAILAIRPSGPSIVPALVQIEARPGATAGPNELDNGHEIMDFLPISALRPGRVYALDEFRAAEASPGEGGIAIADARVIRIDCGSGLDAWLCIADDRISFGAVDSALLSGLAPFIAHAMRSWAGRLDVGTRLQLATSLLARLGVGWSQLDAAGRIIGSEPAQPARASEVMQRLSEPAPDTGTAWATTTLWRAPVAGRDACIIAALRQTFGLSAREAALAWAIAQGEPLPEAGARLGLTRETARNYSKRIYLKTGTGGQADLARLCHTSVAVLA